MFSLNDSEIYSNEQNYLPGTASLIEDVDKQIMVVLRDGRTLIGYLRSIDQYANLLLSSTFERIHVGKKYGDIPKGKLKLLSNFKFILKLYLKIHWFIIKVSILYAVKM